MASATSSEPTEREAESRGTKTVTGPIRRASALSWSTISSKRASSTLPFSRPSTIKAGERAQLPRQKTCSRVTAPS